MKVIFFYYYYDDKIKDKKRVEFPPLGMLYLCSALENIGCEVEVIYFDENTKIEDISNADVYAYSISSTASYPTYLQLSEKLKEKAKYHIAGNTQATIFPEQVLKQMNLDVVFTGEGEKTVTDWIKNDCQERGIIKGERVNIEHLPFPARHLIPDEKIYMNNRVGGKSKNSISMISSRGCVFGCKFCAIQNRGKVKFRDLQDFEEEVKYILERYPKCDGITLLDETFTLNTKLIIKYFIFSPCVCISVKMPHIFLLFSIKSLGSFIFNSYPYSSFIAFDIFSAISIVKFDKLFTLHFGWSIIVVAMFFPSPVYHFLPFVPIPPVWFSANINRPSVSLFSAIFFAYKCVELISL